MNKEILKIGVDLGTEKDEQCAVINLHYNGIDHIIYETHDKEQVGVLNRIMCRLEAIENAEPSEALDYLNKIVESFNETTTGMYGLGEVVVANDLIYGFEKELNTIKQALLKAEKEHNSVNLLMQELDCKDFADLRKYARCGYERLNSNNFKYSKEVKIEIPESSLMDYNPVKQYLKWEDLEFKEKELVGQMKVKLGDNIYYIEWFKRNDYKVVNFYTNVDDNILQYTSSVSEGHKQFFNDLHLERVEE